MLKWFLILLVIVIFKPGEKEKKVHFDESQLQSQEQQQSGNYRAQIFHVH